MYMLLVVLWDKQEVVTRQKGYHVPHFRATRGTNQFGLVSPTLFNFIVNNVVRNWLAPVVEGQLFAQEGLKLTVGMCLGLLYTDNSVV